MSYSYSNIQEISKIQYHRITMSVWSLSVEKTEYLNEK